MMQISERMARSVMSRYAPQEMRWHYEHGLVLQSIFLTGLYSGKHDLHEYVKTMYDTKITPKGEILTYRENEYNLDQINPGKTLFLLYNKYSEEKYRITIEKLRDQLRNHPRTKSNGFWHKQIYPWQMWLDGLYMQAPFYAQYTAEFGTTENSADFDDIIHQFKLVEEKTRNSSTGLLYHAWDESTEQAWADKQTGCSPHFWGRALGWFCMALVDTIDFLPQKYSDELKTIACRLLEPLMNYQDKTCGLWYQVLDKNPNNNENGNYNKNYIESSASSMFTYFMLKMLRLGFVPQVNIEQVKAAAIKAYKSLLENKIYEDSSGNLHLTGICSVAGLGGKPYRDGSFEYYVSEPVVEDDFKGVGPFILASLEYENLKI
jgi:unsaturated rhamnogalacturonyl hydrolase